MSIIKVAHDSRTKLVAGSIAHAVRQTGRAEVQAIGAGALNQSIKALTYAIEYLAEDGINAICIPSRTMVMINGQARTAIRLIIEPR